MKWTTTRQVGWTDAGTTVEEVTLTMTGGSARHGCWNEKYGDGRWLVVKSPYGNLKGQVRTWAELESRFGITKQILDTVSKA